MAELNRLNGEIQMQGADPTVFYAWQNDRPGKVNRHFIRAAAESAVKKVVAKAELVDSPRLDHDTKGLPGAPEIANAIFEKIDSCALFVADVTFAGSFDPQDAGKDSKLLPNSNVILELGYAAAQIGWERIILVQNTFYGPTTSLPFDLIHRRHPITYSCDPAIPGSYGDAKTSLTKALEWAIGADLKAQHEAVVRTIARLDAVCMNFLMSKGNTAYFHLANPTNPQEVLLYMTNNIGIGRLLDLGVLRYDCDPQDVGMMWSYKWTYLGKLIIRHLKIFDLFAPTAPH
ncbi:hypothetical protein BH10PLA2_BH10PLA2_15400 [soil metagenome]